jgi:ribosomal protein S18 acetylase RimI-like enzyme
VIIREGGVIQGFVTCKIQNDTHETLGVKIGTVVLVATTPASQGKGYGKQLVQGALHWFAEQGCDVVDVGTQLANIPAARLYETAGFRMVGSSLSLRKMLKRA